MAPIEYVSAAEAGRRIGVTEKTVRTWIEQGKLSAHHPGGVKNRLAIPVSEVEAIARERGQYQAGEIPSLADLARQVEQLRAQLAQQQAEIERLKEQQAAPAPALSAGLWQEEYTPSAQPARPARSPRRQSASESEPLPPGAILARHFAEQHGVNPYTFRDQYTKGRYGDICLISSRPKPGRPGETEYYVMPEQAEAVYDYWRRNDVSFSRPGNDQAEQE